jgi:hypothetical protein
MQSAELGSHVSWWKTATNIYFSPKGLKAFTVGLLPCAMRAIPACSVMFTTVDLVRNKLS